MSASQLFILEGLVVAFVFAVGCWLSWSAQGASERREQWGRSLATLAMGGVLFLPAQAWVQLQIKDRDRTAAARSAKQARRDELLLQIGLHHNLRGIDLRGADLRGLYLRDKDLSGADLRSAKLNRANLVGANLSGTDLSRADLSEANAERASFRRAHLTATRFASAHLRKADFSSASDGVRAGSFGTASLGDLASGEEQFIDSKARVDFTDADLTSARLISTDLQAHFRRAILASTDLERANLSGDDFRGAYLANTKARGATFENAKLNGSLLFGVDFSRAVFVGADFTNATVTANSSLRHSDLRGARISRLRFAKSVDWHRKKQLVQALTLGLRPDRTFWAARVDERTKRYKYFLGFGAWRYTPIRACADRASPSVSFDTYWQCGRRLSKAYALPRLPRMRFQMIQSERGGVATGTIFGIPHHVPEHLPPSICRAVSVIDCDARGRAKLVISARKAP